MNDLENLLASLSPRAASANLEQRVNEDLQQDLSWALPRVQAARPRWLQPLLWSGVGAAAAVLLMQFSTLLIEGSSPSVQLVGPGQPAAHGSLPTLLPVSTLREIVQAESEGIRYHEGLPEQHMRITSLERQAWIDPRDGAQITIEVPREESLVLPVSFQ